MTSIFNDKDPEPTLMDLYKISGYAISIWQSLADYITEAYPKVIEEGNYSGTQYGWSFRIKNKKRAILYLLPCNRLFKIAFVFGQKATGTIMKSDISGDIKAELQLAMVYAEGRGLKIEVANRDLMKDLKKLIDI